MRALKKFALGCLVIALFPGGCIMTTGGVVAWQAKSYKHPVDKEIPEVFPVLVVTRAANSGAYTARILFHEDLEAYLSEVKEYSFLVPPEMEAQLNEQISQQCRWQTRDFSSDSSVPWSASFTVESSQEGSQALRVFATWDDDRVNTGWYTAEDQSFTPVAHQKYFGLGLVMGAMFPSLFLTVALYVLAGLILLIYFSRKKRRERLQKADVDVD